MALGITFTQILPLYPSRIYMQWDLIDPTESGSHTFTLSRSGSPNGPWEVLDAGLQNSFNYIDDLRTQPNNPDDGKVNLLSLQRQIYYRIKVVPPSGCANQAEAQTDLRKIGLTPTQAGLRRRLQYDETVLWARFNGVRLALLKRRRWGDHCTTCYDPVTKVVLNDHCELCYGTSYIGGYWDPVVVYGRVYPPQNINVELTERDREESHTGLITLLDIPLLEDGDLIVETDTNNRHAVLKQVRTELRRKPVHQQVSTALIEHNDIAYRLPVDYRAAPPLF